MKTYVAWGLWLCFLGGAIYFVPKMLNSMPAKDPVEKQEAPTGPPNTFAINDVPRDPGDIGESPAEVPENGDDNRLATAVLSSDVDSLEEGKVLELKLTLKLQHSDSGKPFPADEDFAAELQVSGGTEGVDYKLDTNKFQFRKGESDSELTVRICDNADSEADGEKTLTFNTTNSHFEEVVARVVKIVDDDAKVIRIELVGDSGEALEAEPQIDEPVGNPGVANRQNAKITLGQSPSEGEIVNVRVSIADNSVAQLNDLDNFQQVVQFKPGDKSRIFEVVARADSVKEGVERLELNMGLEEGSKWILATSSLSLQIRDAEIKGDIILVILATETLKTPRRQKELIEQIHTSEKLFPYVDRLVGGLHLVHPPETGDSTFSITTVEPDKLADSLELLDSDCFDNNSSLDDMFNAAVDAAASLAGPFRDECKVFIVWPSVLELSRFAENSVHKDFVPPMFETYAIWTLGTGDPEDAKWLNANFKGTGRDGLRGDRYVKRSVGDETVSAEIGKILSERGKK